jgi:hypothetical protein
MAIWHFKIALIPQAWLDSGGDLAALVEEAGCDLAAAWAADEPAELEARLTRALPRRRSWHPGLELWGAGERDDIRLWRERGRIGSIAVRFDLRNPNMALFGEVIAIARDFDLAVFVPRLKRVIPAEVDALLRVAGESDAAHFVIDPRSFLSQADPVNAKAT